MQGSGANFEENTAQQPQLDLRLSWDSVHGSYCSNIEQTGLPYLFFPVPLYVQYLWWWPMNER
jgi:hypothetical protein